MTVHLKGTENLPPFIKKMLDSSYNYHAHELKCEPGENGFNYKYSLTISKFPLDPNHSTTQQTTSDDPTTAPSLVTEESTTKSVKCATMIQIKFILLHLDTFGNRVQSMFNEEVSTEETLHNVIMGFREKCLAKMQKGKRFRPRISFCIGEVKGDNSKPIYPEDLLKTINELVEGQPLSGKIAFVVDTLDHF